MKFISAILVFALLAGSAWAEVRPEALYDEAWRLSLSDNAADKQAAVVLFEKLEEQKKAAGQNRDASQENFQNYLLEKKDVTGDMIRPKLIQGIRLSEADKLRLEGLGLEASDIQRLIDQNDFEGLSEALHGQAQATPEDTEAGESKARVIQLRMLDRSGVQAPDEQANEPILANPTVLPGVAFRSAPTQAAPLKDTLPPEYQLREGGIRRPVPGISIFDLASRKIGSTLPSP